MYHVMRIMRSRHWDDDIHLWIKWDWRSLIKVCIIVTISSKVALCFQREIMCHRGAIVRNLVRHVSRSKYDAYERWWSRKSDIIIENGAHEYRHVNASKCERVSPTTGPTRQYLPDSCRDGSGTAERNIACWGRRRSPLNLKPMIRGRRRRIAAMRGGEAKADGMRVIAEIKATHGHHALSGNGACHKWFMRRWWLYQNEISTIDINNYCGEHRAANGEYRRKK